MLETINILLTMFNMCNVHLLAVNKVQIQIIIEETESGGEISSPSSLDKVIFETTKHRSGTVIYQNYHEIPELLRNTGTTKTTRTTNVVMLIWLSLWVFR